MRHLDVAQYMLHKLRRDGVQLMGRLRFNASDALSVHKLRHNPFSVSCNGM